MRVLITGITGFVGRYLAEHLSMQPGVRVYGLARQGDAQKRICACDIRDRSRLEKVLRSVRPQRIFHLAAQSSVQISWRHPKETFEQNFVGTLNLLEAVRKTRFSPLIQLAGSAQEYGIPPKNIRRIDESAPMNPRSPYAVSKVCQDAMACQYIRHFGLKIVRTRAFNHIGPRQSEAFVTSGFARQIALIETGRQRPVIRVGNLDAVRDYTDVRDVVRAYWLALEKGKPGEVYNVASGRGYTAGQILKIYLDLCRVKVKIRKDPSLTRSDDLPRLVGDSHKFQRRTGWRPQIPLKRSLADILDFWRDEIKANKGKR